MRWNAGIFGCLLLLTTSVRAQNPLYGIIKGLVLDSNNNSILEGTSISVHLISDSTLVNYALSGRKGEFIVTNIPLNKPCKIIVTNKGYEKFTRIFIITDRKKELNLDTIRLIKMYKELKQVTITAQRPPFSINQDTLEFTASAFKTIPNALLEDLLIQLPGVEIDKDGNITINGKKVVKVTLDGKDFFGNDPYIAFKNLPKDIIDKLQVIDNKNRRLPFSKTSRNNEDVSINLTLKKEVQRGWSGRVSAGYGSSQRYEGASIINFFRGSKQLNFIANSNNTNRASMSGNDFNITNARSTLDGGNGGVTRSTSGGLNFSENIGQQLKLNGSYFININHTDKLSSLQRQNKLPDSIFFYKAINNTSNNYLTHRLSFNANYIIDTLTELNLSSNIVSNKIAVTNINNATTNSFENQILNANKNRYATISNIKNISTELVFSHHFLSPRREINIGLSYNYNNSNSTNSNDGQSEFYKSAVLDSLLLLKQHALENGMENNLFIMASYSEPLTKNITAVLGYNYNRSINRSNKVTNLFNEITGKYDTEDSLYTNGIRNFYEEHNPEISILYNKSRYRMALVSGIQFLQQNNLSINSNKFSRQNYINLIPSFNLGFNFSTTGSVSAVYNGRSQQPSIQQLQPAPDNSNPLYLQIGNPDLRPSFYHNISIQIRESIRNTYWSTGFNFNTTQKQIINQIWYDNIGRQVSQPVNTNGNLGLSSNIQYSRNWKKGERSLRINVNTNGYYNLNHSFINKSSLASTTYSVSQSVGFNYTFKQLFSISPSFNIRFNKAYYSTESISDAEFITKSFTLSTFWNKPNWLIVENNLQYSYNSQITPGYKKNITLWSAALNLLMFNNQQGMLRFAVYDILKQNSSLNSRSITQTYIEDRQTQTLERYLLLSFIYNFKKRKPLQ